jgi:hypothetical protein
MIADSAPDEGICQQAIKADGLHTNTDDLSVTTNNEEVFRLPKTLSCTKFIAALKENPPVPTERRGLGGLFRIA